jgi:hypothetical protein
MKALVAVCLVAFASSIAAHAGPVPAKTRPQTGNGIEAVGSAAWPAVAAQLAKNIARDSFAHDYARVWRYLHPAYQQAVSQARWQACQRSHPAAPRNITITRVAVAQANQLPIHLSLLGRQNVQEIQLYVQYKTPTLAGPQVAVLYTFWLKARKAWTAVWPGEEYAAYRAGRCYLTAQGQAPLY